MRSCRCEQDFSKKTLQNLIFIYYVAFFELSGLFSFYKEEKKVFGLFYADVNACYFLNGCRRIFN